MVRLVRTAKNDEDVLERCKEQYLNDIERSNEEKATIERNTILQKDSREWLELRRSLITASNFSRVIKRKQNMSAKNLGATPDDIIGEDTIVEMKCPISVYRTSLGRKLLRPKKLCFGKSLAQCSRNLRSHRDRNDNPTVRLFESIYKKMLVEVYLELMDAESGNCLPLEQITILHRSSTSPVDRINLTTARQNSDRHDIDASSSDEQLDGSCILTLSTFGEKVVEYTLDSFRRRNIDLSLRKPENTSATRSYGFNF
ncbi:unnamed protein product [Plutella xylostella]|uniref:(diamondback moth) hypothetical protein n=1 Tax=Plutella xylostella TaxID=51655 RepID=A0A8S4FNP8_PLUXY|nr:unnamed protein product [Plutella xylostella]